MSSYNNKMIESSLPPYGPRDALARESFIPPYSYNRRDIEVNDGAMWRQVARILRKHWKASLAFVLLLELVLVLLVPLHGQHVCSEVGSGCTEPPGVDTIGLERNAGTAKRRQYAGVSRIRKQKSSNSDGLALGVIDQLHLDQNPIFVETKPVAKIDYVARRMAPAQSQGNRTTRYREASEYFSRRDEGRASERQPIGGGPI